MTRTQRDVLRTLNGPREIVDRTEFAADSRTVARVLLGQLLVRDEDDAAPTIVRIIETEAYHEEDPASHSHRGRTAANRAMFGRPGHLYVYLTYGMHHCMNVSCEAEGTGAAVLLRAAVLVSGEEAVRRRRGHKHRERDLLRGPGRLTQALGIDRGRDGVDLTAPGSPLRIETDGWRPDETAIASGPRVGIRHAADVPWRYWIEDLAEVSRYTRHPRADD